MKYLNFVLTLIVGLLIALIVRAFIPPHEFVKFDNTSVLDKKRGIIYVFSPKDREIIRIKIRKGKVKRIPIHGMVELDWPPLLAPTGPKPKGKSE